MGKIRFIFSFIALFFSFCISSYSNQHDYGCNYEEDGIYYEFDYLNKTAKLVHVEIDDSHTTIDIPSTICFDNENYTIISIEDYVDFTNRTNSITSIHIPETVTHIGDHISWGKAKVNIPKAIEYIGYYTFAKTNIDSENLVLPNIKHIGNSAFEGCKSIKTVDLSESELDTIPEYAFSECSKLQEVYTPQKLKCICDWAFFNTDLRHFTITQNVDSLGNAVFCEDSLLNLAIDPNNNTYRLYLGNIYDKELTTFIWYNGFTSSDVVETPPSTIEIRRQAFLRSKKIKYVEADNVKKIGMYAFCACPNLETIIVPSIEYVERSVFTCGVKTIILPTSLKQIFMSMFAHLSTYYGQKMETFTCPSEIEEIGPDAFSANIQLKSVTLSQKLKDIGYLAFYGTSLSAIDIPENVEHIGESAFDRTPLNTVIVRSKTPPTCDNVNSFCTTEKSEENYVGFLNYQTKVIDLCQHYCHNTYENATLYVPKESFELYKTTYPWSEFKKIRYIGQPEPYVLNDGETFAETETTEKEGLEYYRTFNNTDWQALYVPFSMSYDDWKDDFEVGKINDVNMYDTDDDGEFDVTEIELLKIKHGSTEANTPYFIKAKTTGDKVISLEKVTLYPAEENYVDCSSTEMLFTFQGTYSGVSGADMYANKYYALSGGSLCYAEDASVSLKPMRWYMKSEARKNKHSTLMNNVRVRVVGEDATGINETRADKSTQKATYMLDGRAINPSNLKKGIYIRNGKKIVL